MVYIPVEANRALYLHRYVLKLGMKQVTCGLIYFLSQQNHKLNETSRIDFDISNQGNFP